MHRLKVRPDWPLIWSRFLNFLKKLTLNSAYVSDLLAISLIYALSI